MAQNGGWKKRPQTVPTGRVIKYPKKCALFCPPGGRPGGAPRGGPRGGPQGGPQGGSPGPPKRGPNNTKTIYIGPRSGPSRGGPGGVPGGVPGGPRGAPGGRPGGRGAPGPGGGNFPRGIFPRAAPPPGGRPGREVSHGACRGTEHHKHCQVCDAQLQALPVIARYASLRGCCPVTPRHVVQLRDVTLCLGGRSAPMHTQLRAGLFGGTETPSSGCMPRGHGS